MPLLIMVGLKWKFPVTSSLNVCFNGLFFFIHGMLLLFFFISILSMINHNIIY